MVISNDTVNDGREYWHQEIRQSRRGCIRLTKAEYYEISVFRHIYVNIRRFRLLCSCAGSSWVYHIGSSLEEAIEQITDAMNVRPVTAEEKFLPISPPTPQDQFDREQGFLNVF